MSERVLVIPNELVAHLSGYVPYIPFPFKQMTFMDRREAETNESFRQVIPYILISCGDRYLIYQRMNGGEPRLDCLWSLGVGGHVNEESIEDAINRELKEEIFIGSRVLSNKYCGLIICHETSVDLVHVGMVWHLTLEKPLVTAAEPCIANLQFILPSDITQHLEKWSQILLGEYIYAN